MHESLYEELHVKRKASVDVAIWLNINEKERKLEDKRSQETNEDRKLRKQIDEKVQAFAEKLKRRYKSERIRIDGLAPVVYTTLRKLSSTQYRKRSGC